MKYIHAKFIVHRDIKPENLIIDKNNQIYLIDFNVSRKFDGQSAKLMTKTGTPEFQAPEMLSQTTYTEKVDIWSCGIVFYMLLTGSFPFNMG